MKKIVFFISIVILFSVSSCVTSLQPLASYNTAITDNRITGTWNTDGQVYTVQKFFESDFYKKHKDDKGIDGSPKKWNTDEASTKKEKQDSLLYSKSYFVKYTKDNLEYHLFGSMVKLNGQYFMNFTGIDLNVIDSTSDTDNVTFADRLTTNTIARIGFVNSNTIKLDFIDGGFLYDQIKTGHIKIKNETDELYDTFLITASTAELQQFLEKYGNDNRFFNKENSVTLNRKS